MRVRVSVYHQKFVRICPLASVASLDAIGFRDILFNKKATSSYNYLLTLIDLSNIVKVTISSPTLSQGVSRICQ